VTVGFDLRRVHPVLLFAGGLAALLALAWLVYYPGLAGSFLFDDYVNLKTLGIMGPIQDWPSLARYVASGGSTDPIGRPLSMLTFLIDAQNWPADAWSFKRTNVLLHLLNGVLLCWLMLELGTRRELDPAHARRAALLGTAMWLLHPLFVSTTLYVVQREAMLPATFAFAGLLAWCKGRQRLDDGRTRSASLLMAGGSLVGTLLSSLCKANGALLPLLIAAAEVTVLRKDADASGKVPRHRLLYAITLWLPLLVLAAGLIALVPRAIRIAAEARPWTVGQRLLSEPRVLVDYLRLLWIPRSNSFDLFNDQISASTGWLDPWTTLPSIVFIVGMAAFGWLFRKRYPEIAFAILFYLGGQVIESTFLPLELAFEHRNYLPAAFMFWPAAIWLSKSDTSFHTIRRAIAVVSIIVLAGLTWTKSQVWGDPRMQGLVWAKINPDSPRAQGLAANIETMYGHYDEAIARLQNAARRMPDDPLITLNILATECARGAISEATWTKVLHSLEYSKSSPLYMDNWLESTVDEARVGACEGLTLPRLKQALAAISANRLAPGRENQKLKSEHIAGLIALAENRPEEALDHFNHAIPNPSDRGYALAQAASLGMAGRPDLGLEHLTFAQSLPPPQPPPWGMMRVFNWVLEKQGYWEHETDVMHHTLIKDATQRGLLQASQQE
jgi:tetratricopeptide (TPR) repeat protein